MQQYLANNSTTRSTNQLETPSPTYHGPSSRRLGKQRASQSSQASSSSSTSQFRLPQSASQTGSQTSSAIWIDSPSPSLSSPAPISDGLPTHDYPTPTDKAYVRGVTFNVNFNHVYRKGERLQPSRLGYAVKHKSKLAGGRMPSSIWLYELQL